MDIETENVINLIFPEGISGKINYVIFKLIVLTHIIAFIVVHLYRFMQLRFQNLGKKIPIFISISQNLEALM